MTFTSIEFLIFFLVVLLSLKFLPNNTSKHCLLLSASYIYYFSIDKLFLLLLFTMSVFTWLIGKFIVKRRQNNKNPQLPFMIGIVMCVSTLAFFKYFDFFVESFSVFFNFSTNAFSFAIPIGISFYTFQAISYISDVYTSKISPEKSPITVLLYISFFPQIVCGPIVKAHDFLPQLNKNITITAQNFSEGFQLFLRGMFKKMVVADRLNVCVSAVFDVPAAYSGLSIFLAVFSYSIQIYCDFSGYSDMAIGIAKALGFDLGKNFDLPYLAQNPTDFWRRWHISLSSWFRDYVYIPLGGNRNGKFKTYFNIFITMLLSGLWHGASWTFVFWGAMHGLGNVVHKIFRSRHPKKLKPKKYISILSILANFIFVMLLWIPFRASDFTTVGIIMTRMFSMTAGVNYVFIYTIIFGILFIAINVYTLIWNDGREIYKTLDLSKFSSKLIVCIFILIIFVYAYIGDTAFIYEQF